MTMNAPLDTADDVKAFSSGTGDAMSVKVDPANNEFQLMSDGLTDCHTAMNTTTPM